MLWSQEENSILVNSHVFSSRDGYIISNPYNAIYDDNGWLWILGENKLSNEYIHGEKEVIIQRFDGAHFFTLKIPDTGKKKIKKGHFFKHKDNRLYLKLYYKVARAELFLVNTATLEIKPVTAYNNLDKKIIISEEYYANNATRLILTSKYKFYSAELNDLNIKLIDSIPFNKPVDKPYLGLTRTSDDFSLVKLLFEKDGCFLDQNGRITGKIKAQNFINKLWRAFFPEHNPQCVCC